MDIHLSYDWDTITSIITSPENWEYMSDDFDELEGFTPPKGDDKYYLLDGRGGLFMFYFISPIHAQAHVCALRHARGLKAVNSQKSAIKWIFQNTDCLKITALIPEFNKRVERLSMAVGLKYEGRIEKCYMKHGCLRDQLIYGISKGRREYG